METASGRSCRAGRLPRMLRTSGGVAVLVEGFPSSENSNERYIDAWANELIGVASSNLDGVTWILTKLKVQGQTVTEFWTREDSRDAAHTGGEKHVWARNSANTCPSTNRGNEMNQGNETKQGNDPNPAKRPAAKPEQVSKSKPSSPKDKSDTRRFACGP
eukprot:Skav231244  [mRNA]  locus=scaffold411:131661:133469:+ [translate_table: standard]